MHLFLAGVLPFLAHDHPSAVAFLTCRYHNFHSSIIPEFLSRGDSFLSFCWTRQWSEIKADGPKRCSILYHLFVQTPLMQFSPSLLLPGEDCTETILEPLLGTKYFTRTVERCLVLNGVTCDLLQGLSKVQSLIKLDFERKIPVKNQHLEIIVNSFPSLETLTIYEASSLDPTTAIGIASPPPRATKTLRSLTMKEVPPLFATQFVPHFTNLRKLVLDCQNSSRKLDLLHLSSSLPLLTDLSLKSYTLESIESLKKLVHLSSLHFRMCKNLSSSFLSQENRLPLLTTLSIALCEGLSNSSFASLANAPNLRALEVVRSEFSNNCFQYLENMVHLRTLRLASSNIVGDSQSLKTLMQNLFQLEELDLGFCRHIGNQGAVAGALYSIHSRLRVLNLSYCNIADDDLNGIGLLKNTLEVLDLTANAELTNEGLVHCKDLVKLKNLKLFSCDGMNHLSPLKDCLNLEELDVSGCKAFTDDSFKVFSEEPNSFPNLRVLSLSACTKLTEKVFEHFAKNSNLVYQLKELHIRGMSAILSSSATARKNICQLKGLRQLHVTRLGAPDVSKNVKLELLRELKTLESFY